MASTHSSVISSTIINLPFNIIYQHVGLSLQIEFAFIPEGGESGTCACSDKDNVSRQILVMEACIWSHRFVLDPCAIAFILSTSQVFSLMPAFYHFTYQSVRPTVQHQFLRFVSSSELSFSKLPNRLWSPTVKTSDFIIQCQAWDWPNRNATQPTRQHCTTLYRRSYQGK